MFSTELAYTLEAAVREASNRRHTYFCLEHLLFALLHDAQVKEIVIHCGGDILKLKKELEEFFDTQIEKHAEVSSESDEYDVDIEPLQTPAVQRVLQLALIEIPISYFCPQCQSTDHNGHQQTDHDGHCASLVRQKSAIDRLYHSSLPA